MAVPTHIFAVQPSAVDELMTSHALNHVDVGSTRVNNKIITAHTCILTLHAFYAPTLLPVFVSTDGR